MKIKVTRILDDSHIAFSASEAEQFDVGDVIEIYEIGEEIFDPDTKKSLGKLEIVKGRMVVSSVQSKMCVAKKQSTQFARHVENLPSFLSGFRNRSMESEYEEIKLDKTDSDYAQKLIVKVGNLIRVVELSYEK